MKQGSIPIDWNARFAAQAVWTKPLRDFLSKQLSFSKYSKVLEAGSGTGVILRDIALSIGASPVGIDVDFQALVTNKKIRPGQVVACSDVFELPFTPATFDFVICHYFLLWLKEPIAAMREMYRVLKPNGVVVAFAEPDYTARVESPHEFELLGKLQTESLKNQGINIQIGRKLPEVFSKAGYEDIQYGVSGFQSPAKSVPPSNASEWEILHFDLDDMVSQNKLDEYRSLDKQSRLEGSRVSWVPTFYAYGRKPALE